MIDGLSGAPIPTNLNLPYAAEIQAGVEQAQAAGRPFPPCLAYAGAWRETIRGRAWLATLGQTPANAISGDGGHGLFQLTSWYPSDWDNPRSNAYWAVMRWFSVDLAHYVATGVTDPMTLVKEVCDSFNAGDGAVQRQLDAGRPVDNATTHQNYGFDVWTQYQRLLAGEFPTSYEVSP